MAMLINGAPIESIVEKFGVQWTDFDGDICEFPTLDEAESIADETDGILVHWFIAISQVTPVDDDIDADERN